MNDNAENSSKSNSKYIGITQDGIGRILFDQTPPNIQGLYTESLQTCIAVIAVGAKGISLIHDTGKISGDSIKREIALLGKISFWTIVYNPEHYPGGFKNKDLSKKSLRVTKHIQEIAGSDTFLINSKWVANYSHVSINRENIVDIENNHLNPNNVIFPKNKVVRHDINTINNLFLDDQEECEGDLQYDGSTRCKVPNIKKDWEIAKAMLTCPKFEKAKREDPENITTISNVWKKYQQYYPDYGPTKDTSLTKSFNFNLPNIQKVADSINKKYGQQEQQSNNTHLATTPFWSENNNKNTEKLNLTSLIEKYTNKKDKEPPSVEIVFHRIAGRGIKEELEYLIPHIKDINFQAEKDRTALHISILQGNAETTKALLDAKAKSDIKDASNKTAKEYASELGSKEIKKLFDPNCEIKQTLS